MRRNELVELADRCYQVCTYIFVSCLRWSPTRILPTHPPFLPCRNPGRRRPLNCGMSVARTVFWLDAVRTSFTSPHPPPFLLCLTRPPKQLTFRFPSRSAGIPQIYHFGQEGLHNILVIDLLGPSLEDLFDMCSRKFSIKTVCMAARQMVSRLMFVPMRI